jgi:phospholipid/cholesterol/gamma-HCH transport system permease protein
MSDTPWRQFEFMSLPSGSSVETGTLSIERGSDGALVLHLAGPWILVKQRPSLAEVERALKEQEARRVVVDASAITQWDTGLMTFATGLSSLCASRSIEVSTEGLPAGARRLLALAAAVPDKGVQSSGRAQVGLLGRIGRDSQAAVLGAAALVDFVGEAALSVGRLLRGRARVRFSDFFYFVQQSGAEALGIVTLISFIVGLILAFVGAIQLKQFGAVLYVADLVGIAMAREMGAVMTAVIMAGRTGAAFAAQLGTMKVNEEIDALATMGISPMDYLVLPRMLALCLMMPLLCLYADLTGICGGAVVGVGMLDLSWTQYAQETMHAISLSQFANGLVKSVIFGALVALAGCQRGMKCGNNAAAVGDAATSAVVLSLVLIVVADGVIAVISNALGV